MSRTGFSARTCAIDGVVLLLVVGAVLGFFAHASAVLEYGWRWSSIPQYFVRWDAAAGHWRANVLLDGLMMTLRLSLIGGALALIGAVPVALARSAPSAFLRLASFFYVELGRNIPPLVFVLIFYFFAAAPLAEAWDARAVLAALDGPARTILELLLGPASLAGNLLTGLLCLVLLEAAFMAEVIRGHLAALSVSQAEAARMLGLGPIATLRHVLLPQALRRAVPGLVGQLITLLKASSLVSLISVQELAFVTAQAANSTRSFFEFWIVTAAIFFVLGFTLSSLSRRLEPRF